MRHRGLFITGVGTEIGKTVAAGAIAHLLKKDGYKIAAMKPVQTGAKGKKGSLSSPDADFVRKVAGLDDPYDLAVPYLFKKPLSPYHAALLENRTVNVDRLGECFDKLHKGRDLVIVEGAGGLMAPVTQWSSWPELIRLLDIPIVLVTHPELGMIHQTLSTVLTAEMHGLEIAGMVMVHTNKKKHPDIDLKWLEKRAGYPLLGIIPHTASVKGGQVNTRRFRAHAEKHFPLKPLKSFLERRSSRSLQKKLQEKDFKYVWHPFTQQQEWEKEEPLIIDSGRWTLLKDIHGKEYYDGMSAYWVNVHGHSEPQLTRALAKQAGRLDHSTFLGLTHRPAIELAEKIVELSPAGLDKVFYSDNGSTAVEAGMKMAVQYHRQKEKPQTKRTKFMALGEAYHGDTLGAVAVGGVQLYRKVFGPLLTDVVFAPEPYCYRCPLGKSYPDCSLACATEMERLIEEHADELAGFVIEPMVQCPGGIITAPPGYLSRVRQACTRHGVLLIADEVAVGFGRTGKLFAVEHEEVTPDIMAVAKSLGGGLVPIAATLASQQVYDAFLGSHADKKTLFHGHTFTAWPPACSVALESLKLYKRRKVIPSLEAKSHYLRDRFIRFLNLPNVGEVRQLGMIAGVEVVKDRETGEAFPWEERVGHRITVEARRHGLIVRNLGDVMVFFPVLASSGKDLLAMTDILYEAIAAVTGRFEKNEP